MNRCLVMECELNGMDASDYETNLFGSSSTLDKIMSFLSVNAFGANLGKNGSLTALNNHSRSMESMGSMTGSRNRLDTPPQRKNSRAGMIHLNPSLRKSIPEWEEMENEIVASGTPNTAVQVVYGPPFKSVIESFPPPMIKDSARSAGKNRLVVPMEKSMPNRASDVSLESLLQHIEKDFPVETNNNN